MIYFDTETCGLHGFVVLIQYAKDEGDVTLYNVWDHPVDETLSLIESFTKEPICGFNLAFDWFHLCKAYTTLSFFKGYKGLLIDRIDDIALAEEKARFGPCLKPTDPMDLMLHARKGPYQSTMNRNDIVVRRVPTVLAWQLAKELDKRINIKDIYFERFKDSSRRWDVYDIEGTTEFKDLKLKFAPSSALKALAVDALGLETIKFQDIAPPSNTKDVGFAPYATAPYYENGYLYCPRPGKWCEKWPDYGKIRLHIDHWNFNHDARQYAKDDVEYTRSLYHFFNDPTPGDRDSILACLVAAVRWRGFNVDVEGIKALKSEAVDYLSKCEYNFNSPNVCKKYILEKMSDIEKLAITKNGKVSTGSILLEHVSDWKQLEYCSKCDGVGCEDCSEGFVASDENHPAASRAKEIISFRKKKKEIELYDKLITAGRFHASYKIIGARSSRMSGADGLNPQGIDHRTEVRKCFKLADDGMMLSGGDFQGFEVAIMISVYSDKQLETDFLSGKKLYGILGPEFFPGETYESILASKGKGGRDDKYDRSKKGVLALFYGGEGYTLSTRVGIDEERGQQAFNKFMERYPNWRKHREEIYSKFCSMQQPGGIGSKVEWHEPADYVESLFGFRRYFTLENQICKTLFDLAEDPPKEWTQLNAKIVRRDREQSVSGAVRSALFGAAFGMQAANMRAAANHEIQSTGAEITKELECEVWKLQPVGIHPWVVQPMNIHDELQVVHKPEVAEELEQRVKSFVKTYQKYVKHLAIDWEQGISDWSEK